jgi:hypothetical protein
MPTRNQSGKPEHLFQNPNRKRKKSHRKLPKAIKTYLTLLKRRELEGDTKWILAEMEKAEKKLKKYGITQQMIQERLED